MGKEWSESEGSEREKRTHTHTHKQRERERESTILTRNSSTVARMDSSLKSKKNCSIQAWGGGKKGREGRGKDQNFIFYPKKLKTPPKEILSLSLLALSLSRSLSHSLSHTHTHLDHSHHTHSPFGERGI